MTERGKPVAKLTDIGKGGAPEGRLAELVRQGRLRPPTGSSALQEEALVRPVDAAGLLLKALLDERVESR